LARMTASETSRAPADSGDAGTRPEHRADATRSGGVTVTGVNAAEVHAREAAGRDELAKGRDNDAAERDRAADRRDHEIAEVERSLSPDGPVTEGLRRQLRAVLAEAASDRAAAADDRRLAARDRERAAEERALALEALRVAHVDDLTGAHRRGFGEDMLRSEMDRARRSGGRLALVMVDVDGLKEVNDKQGHLAGDALLQDLVAAIRAKVRSYEPIVRLGGDEFAFTIGGVDTTGAEERCAAICADLGRRPSQGRITVGISELGEGDEFEDLSRRADSALIAARLKQRSRSG
jgi:diguanylate cyclase (GGDEF)-like protein